VCKTLAIEFNPTLDSPQEEPLYITANVQVFGRVNFGLSVMRGVEVQVLVHPLPHSADALLNVRLDHLRHSLAYMG
jgi:hypothetical protein